MRQLGEGAAAPGDGSGLERLSDMSRLTRLRRSTLPGNLVAALYRSRRSGLRALRAARAARRDRGHALPAPDPRREYRAVYVIPAGPRDWDPLRDTIDSVLQYEAGEAKIVVVDDASTDCRPARVRSAYPQVDVVHRHWPSGGPPRDYPVLAHGIRAALERYDFEVLFKLDTDALVTGPAPSAAVAAMFAERPQLGMVGTHLVRADGLAEDYEFDRWVLRHTVRWSRSARRLVERARAGGYSGAKVRGGVYAVSRAALDATARSGDLTWRPPWWTQLNEDFWMSAIVLANGFGLGSAGGPDEPFVVASNFVPMDKEQVLAERKLAIHSVRRGLRGEDETEMRRYFRAVREADDQDIEELRASRTDSSLPPDR